MRTRTKGNAPVLVGIGFACLLGCGGASRAAAPAPEDKEVSKGYGTEQVERVTGSVSSLSPDEADANVGGVIELLEGRVSGLTVIRLSNGEVSLRIRGSRSLQGDNEPLLVIDDVPVRGAVGTALASIAPQDVARIDVLKDAGATAIYGVRGANGVIVITTKRAR